MTEVDQAWSSTQRNIDCCSICLREKLFKLGESAPSRPISPRRSNPILFLSEAPPLTGGFWRLDDGDDLRSKLMSMLKIQSEETNKSIDLFLNRGFFLLQSIKWPLFKTFNHLAPKKQRELIEHSAQEHLSREIDLLKPKAIFAMGKAAWLSCLFLSGLWNQAVKSKFEQSLGTMHTMSLDGRDVKWMATYLIIGQNLRLPERSEKISAHLNSFLDSAH
jgi:uracil-DNA glycosylase